METDPASLVVAVRLRLEAYFSCIDRRDWKGLGECFAANASAVYNSGSAKQLAGREAIVQRLRVVERFAATNHTLSNTHISVVDDGARAITLALAHLVPAEGGKVLVRGLRYDDELALDAGTWRIRRRAHQPLWQYEAASVVPRY